MILKNITFINIILIFVAILFIPIGNSNAQSFGLGDSMNRQIFTLDATTSMVLFESYVEQGDESFQSLFGVFDKGSGWETPFRVHWDTPTKEFISSTGYKQSAYLTFNDLAYPTIFEISIDNSEDENYAKSIDVANNLNDHSQFRKVEDPYIQIHSTHKDQDIKELTVLWSIPGNSFNSTNSIFLTTFDETGSLISEYSLQLDHLRSEQFYLIPSSYTEEIFIFKKGFSQAATIDLNNITLQELDWSDTSFNLGVVNVRNNYDPFYLEIHNKSQGGTNIGVILKIVDQSQVFSDQELVAEYTIFDNSEFYELFNSTLNQDKKILFKESIILTDEAFKNRYSIVLIDENEISIFELDQLQNLEVVFSKISTSTVTSLSNLYSNQLMSESGLSSLRYTELMGKYMFSWTEKFSSEDDDEFYDILNINYNGHWSPITRVTHRDVMYEMNKGTGSFLFAFFLSGLLILMIVNRHRPFSK